MSRELHAENRQFKRFARHFTRVGIISDLFADASHGCTVKFTLIGRSSRSTGAIFVGRVEMGKGEIQS